MPSDESKGNQLDAIGSLAQRQLDNTILGVILTSNTRLLDAPGNVLLPATSTGLPKDSVANVTQIVTLDESYLSDRVGQVPRKLMARVDSGLRRVLDL